MRLTIVDWTIVRHDKLRPFISKTRRVLKSRSNESNKKCSGVMLILLPLRENLALVATLFKGYSKRMYPSSGDPSKRRPSKNWRKRDAENRKMVLAYGSHRQSFAEQRHTTAERECLAIVWACKKCRFHLLWREVIMCKNHHSLCWMMSIQTTNSPPLLCRITSWNFCSFSKNFNS